MGAVQKSSSTIISLNEGEKVVIEPGGMLAYRNCEMKTHMAAGTIWEKLKSYTLGGELLWRNTFQALPGGGWVELEEQMPGQIKMEELSPEKPALMIRRGAYLASSDNVKFDTQYLGLSGYFSGKGISAIRASVSEGKGKVFFHADGCGVKEFAIRSEEGPMTIDNDMILAYSDNLSCELKNPGSSTHSFLFSGEGLVCEFKGDGVVYVAAGKPGQTTLINEMMGATVSKVSSVIAGLVFLGAIGAVGTMIFRYYTGMNPIEALAWKAYDYIYHRVLG